MIPIAQYGSWRCGRYTVRRICRPDNAYWPRYMILRGEKLVGCSFSVPDAGWCESIERITKLGRYVDKLSEPKRYSYRLSEQAARAGKRGISARRIGRILASLR